MWNYLGSDLPVDMIMTPILGENKNTFVRQKKTEYELAEHLLTVRDPKQKEKLIKSRPKTSQEKKI